MGVNESVAFSDPPYPKSHSTSLFHSMTLHFSLSITHSSAPGPCHHTVPLFLNVLLVRSTLPPLAKSYSFLRSSPSPTASLQPSQDQSPMPPWSTVICVVELAVHSIIIPYMLVLLPQRRWRRLGARMDPLSLVSPTVMITMWHPWQVLIIITRWVYKWVLYHIAFC